MSDLSAFLPTPANLAEIRAGNMEQVALAISHLQSFVNALSAAWQQTIQPRGVIEFEQRQVRAGNLLVRGEVSVDAQVFDAYEEGVWVPADASGAGLALTISAAQFIKLGQLVLASAHIQYPATADGNFAAIGGLPFTNQATTCWGGFMHYSSYGAGVYTRVGSATTIVSFYDLTSAALTNANLSGVFLHFSAVYRASQ